MPKERIVILTVVETGVLANRASACAKLAPGKLSTWMWSWGKDGILERLESPIMSHLFLASSDQTDPFWLVCSCLKGLFWGVVEAGGFDVVGGAKESVLCT